MSYHQQLMSHNRHTSLYCQMLCDKGVSPDNLSSYDTYDMDHDEINPLCVDEVIDSNTDKRIDTSNMTLVHTYLYVYHTIGSTKKRKKGINIDGTQYLVYTYQGEQYTVKYEMITSLFEDNWSMDDPRWDDICPCGSGYIANDCSCDPEEDWDLEEQQWTTTYLYM